MVEKYGWDRGFLAMAVVTVLGTLAFVLAWGAKAHGYAQEVARGGFEVIMKESSRHE